MKISKISKFLMMAFLGAVLLNACSSDDNSDPIKPEPEPQGEFDNGFFVTNEGQFPNEGSITYVSEDFETVEQTVYQNKNDGEDAGSVVQSMFFDEDHALIIANNSNFVTVVDRYTFEKIERIEGESGDFSAPRYGVSANGKGYVTNMGDPNLTILDLDDYSVEKTVDIGKTAEFILKGEDGKLYIQQAAFGSGNTIAVFDRSSEEVVYSIETKENLNSIALTDDFLFAMTGEGIQKFDLSDYSESAMIELDYENSGANIVVDEGHLYFTAGKGVYQMAVDAEEAPETALFEYETDSSFGVFYGFTVHNSLVYIADGGDFASDSFIEVWDADGEFLKTIDVGIGPNGFYFND